MCDVKEQFDWQLLCKAKSSSEVGKLDTVLPKSKIKRSILQRFQYSILICLFVCFSFDECRKNKNNF